MKKTTVKKPAAKKSVAKKAAAKKRIARTPQTLFTASELRQAFQRTAEVVGGDILQACEEMGEPARIPRDALVDSLSMYFDRTGKEIYDAILRGDVTDKDLDAADVPRYWS